MNIHHLLRSSRSIMLYLLKGKVPFSVTLDLTHRCTGNCVFCQIQSDVYEEMSTEQVRTAIDQFHSLGTSRMAFTGGDVLLREDLGELIRHAVSKGLFVSVNSNGNLAVKRSDLISQADMIVFSLDGDPEHHVQTKQGTNPELILEAIRQAKGRGQSVSTITVLTSKNLDSVTWIMETGRRMGFAVTFQPVLRCDMSPDLALEWEPSPEDLKRTTELIIAWAKKGYPVMNSNRYLRMVGEAKYKPKDGSPPCAAGRFYCTVLPDGSVVPCHCAYKRTAFLNGNDVGFDRAFLDMPEFTCQGCLSTAYTELDLIAKGHPGLAFRAMRLLFGSSA